MLVRAYSYFNVSGYWFLNSCFYHSKIAVLAKVIIKGSTSRFTVGRHVFYNSSFIHSKVAVHVEFIIKVIGRFTYGWIVVVPF